MTCKDYELLAQAFADSKPIWQNNKEYRDAFRGWFAALQMVAERLQRDNFRFDRAKFMEAASK